MCEDAAPEDVIRKIVDDDGTSRIASILVPIDTGGEEGVLERAGSPEGGPGPHELVTHFAALSAPPASYPANFPFIPGLGAWVTEYPDGEEATGARWPCGSECAWVVAELQRQSIAAGFTLGSTGTLPAPYPLHEVRLHRGHTSRRLVWAEFDGQGIVQLVDVEE